MDEKIYIVKRMADDWRNEEPLVEEITKALSEVMAENVAEKVKEIIAGGLRDKWSSETKKKFIDRYNAIVDNPPYNLGMRDYEEVVKQLNDSKSKIEALKYLWENYTYYYNQCSINGTGQALTNMQKIVVDISDKLDVDK